MRETCTRTNGSSEHGSFKNGRRNDKLLRAVSVNNRRTASQSLKVEDVPFSWQQVRRSAGKTLNTFDRFMSGERFLFSVLGMLIGFVTFWMSFIFAILSGLNSIRRLLIAALRKCGRSVQRAWKNTRAS